MRARRILSGPSRGTTSEWGSARGCRRPTNWPERNHRGSDHPGSRSGARNPRGPAVCFNGGGADREPHGCRPSVPARPLHAASPTRPDTSAGLAEGTRKSSPSPRPSLEEGFAAPRAPRHKFRREDAPRNAVGPSVRQTGARNLGSRTERQMNYTLAMFRKAPHDTSPRVRINQNQK